MLQANATTTTRKGKASDLLGWAKAAGAEVTGMPRRTDAARARQHEEV